MEWVSGMWSTGKEDYDRESQWDGTTPVGA